MRCRFPGLPRACQSLIEGYRSASSFLSRFLYYRAFYRSWCFTLHARVTGGFEMSQLQLGLCMITSSLCSTNHFCAEAYQVAIGTQDRRMPADGRKQWAWSTCCPRSLRAFEVNPGASSSNARSNLPLPLLLLLAIASCGELSN